MSQFKSNFSHLIERFIEYRKASGSWNEPCYGLNIKLFDHFCADHYPEDTELKQEMVDAWCAKRDTETNRSYETRTRVIRTFIDYLQCRGLINVLPPAALKPEPGTYIPHSFEEDELRRFFHECDSIKPYPGRMTSIIRKLTIPVFFRLLYSSGLRTTEARLLRKEEVDLEHGVLDIRQSKGYDQHYAVLHDTMNSLMQRYDHAVSKLQPARTYFFQSYEGETEHPPAHLLAPLAKALNVTIDELLGIKEVKTQLTAENPALWRRLKKVEDLPKTDQKALLHYLDALLKKNALS